jgi:hypothetical protein
VIATVVVLGEVAAQRDDCCAGKHTVASLYAKRNTGVERLLVTGDAQAFAALAQDPLLRRPAVFGSGSEFAYRAQRPAWGYLAWAVSFGQPHLTGWALVLLAILACGAACGTGALLLERRGTSPWWALGILVVGMETVTELTPELAAFALFACGLLLWGHDRRALAVAALCASVATRETMLVGVAALAVWEWFEHRRDLANGGRRIAPLAWPFAFYAGWALLLRARAGYLPFDSGQNRTGLPGDGLLHVLQSSRAATTVLVGVVLAVAICVAAITLARGDVLTWIATAYLAFSSTFAPTVWETNMAFTRVLLPLYGFGLIAVTAAVHERRARATAASPSLVPTG